MVCVAISSSQMLDLHESKEKCRSHNKAAEAEASMCVVKEKSVAITMPCDHTAIVRCGRLTVESDHPGQIWPQIHPGRQPWPLMDIPSSA